MQLETPKIFSKLIKKVIEDKSLLNNDVFIGILKEASLEWSNFVLQFNAGNNRSYNLNRSGKMINTIYMAVCGQHRAESSWAWILSDVESINKICDFEIKNNVYFLQRHDKPEIDYEIRKYIHMPKDY
jgi:hypothetical protein